MKGKKPSYGTITFNNNRLSYDNVYLDSTYYHMKKTGEKITSTSIQASESKDYSGYYADIDGDGTPDGVIYADLANSKSGEWSDSNGIYSYTEQIELNDYIISKENSSITTFGVNKIITLTKDISKPRFYVMALEDFKEGSFNESSGYMLGTYYWYVNAYDKMSTYETDTSINFGTGYENTKKIIEIWEKNGGSNR